MKHTLFFQVTNGAVVSKGLKPLFQSLVDGRYELQITSANNRSLPQNKFYWSVVVDLIKQGLNDLGNEFSKEEVHEFLKAKFNTTELVNEDTGEIIQVPRSTATLTTIQFSEYIEKIQRFAAEWLLIWMEYSTRNRSSFKIKIMNEVIRKHVTNYNQSKGWETTDESLFETIRECGKEVWSEIGPAHRWYDEKFVVVDLDGILIGYQSFHTTGDASISDMGLEHDIKTVCEVEKKQKTVYYYVKKND